MNFRRGLSGITTRSSTRREMAAPPVQPVVYINTRKEVRKFYGDGDGWIRTRNKAFPAMAVDLFGI